MFEPSFTDVKVSLSRNQQSTGALISNSGKPRHRTGSRSRSCSIQSCRSEAAILTSTYIELWAFSIPQLMVSDPVFDRRTLQLLMRDEFLGYYERELIFLRRMGAEFARKYPKIAARLLLDEEKIEDPHVERMIEAFAFLTGRIGLKLDDELPEITESFLNVLYPHYLAPIPSMAIMQFCVRLAERQADRRCRSSTRGARLNSRPVDGTPCQFRTAYDVELVPIELESAALESPAPKDGRGKYAESFIRLSMRCYRRRKSERDESGRHRRAARDRCGFISTATRSLFFRSTRSFSTMPPQSSSGRKIRRSATRR